MKHLNLLKSTWLIWLWWLLSGLSPLLATAQTTPQDTLNWGRRITAIANNPIPGDGVKIEDLVTGRRGNGDSVIYYVGTGQGEAIQFGPEDTQLPIGSFRNKDHYLFGAYDLAGNPLYQRISEGGGSEGRLVAAGSTGAFYTAGIYGPLTTFSGLDLRQTTTSESVFVMKQGGYETADWIFSLNRSSAGNTFVPLPLDLEVLPDGSVLLSYQYFFSHRLSKCLTPMNDGSTSGQCIASLDNNVTVPPGDEFYTHTRILKVEETGNDLVVRAVYEKKHDTGVAASLELAPAGESILYAAGYPEFLRKYEINGNIGSYPEEFEELARLDVDARAVAAQSLPEGGVVLLAQLEANMTTNFDPNGTYMGAEPTTFSSRGARDLVLLRYDADLNYIWGTQLGGPGQDRDGHLTVKEDLIEVAFTAAEDSVILGLEPRDDALQSFQINGQTDIVTAAYALSDGALKQANQLYGDGREFVYGMASYEGTVSLLSGSYWGNELAINNDTLRNDNGLLSGFVGSIGSNDTLVVIHVREARAVSVPVVEAREVELWGLDGSSVKKEIDDEGRAIFMASDINFDVDQLYVLRQEASGSSPLMGKMHFRYKEIDKNGKRRKEAIVFVHNDLHAVNETIVQDYDDRLNLEWAYRARWKYNYDDPANAARDGLPIGQESNFFQTTMLIPPFQSLQEAEQAGNSLQYIDSMQRPVLFVHGVTGTDRYWGNHEEVVTEEAINDNGGSLDGITDYAFSSYPGRLRRLSKGPQGPAEGPYDIWEFYYPPDQGFAESAYLLDRAVKEVLQNYDGYHDKVSLIAHSMGGLVARCYIEEKGRSYFSPSIGASKQLDTLTYDNDIDQVLFLGTPQHGSFGAHVNYYEPFANELLLELRAFKDTDAPAFREMTPGSSSMMALNSKSTINQNGVTYFQIAGTTATGLIPAGIDTESSDHNDGVVSIGSSNLLDFGVDLGLLKDFAHNHLNSPDIEKAPLEEASKNIIPILVNTYLKDGTFGSGNGLFMNFFRGGLPHISNVPPNDFDSNNEIIRYGVTTPIMQFRELETGEPWIPRHTRYRDDLISPYLGLEGKGTFRFQVEEDKDEVALRIRPELLFPQAMPLLLETYANRKLKPIKKKLKKVEKVINKLLDKWVESGDQSLSGEVRKTIKSKLKKRFEKAYEKHFKSLDVGLNLATPSHFSWGDYWYYSQGNFSEKEFKLDFVETSTGFFPFANNVSKPLGGVIDPLSDVKKLTDFLASEDKREDFVVETLELIEEVRRLDEIGDLPDFIYTDWGLGWRSFGPGNYDVKMVYRFPKNLFWRGLTNLATVPHKDVAVNLTRSQGLPLRVEWSKTTYNDLYLAKWQIEAMEALEVLGGQTYADSAQIPAATQGTNRMMANNRIPASTMADATMRDFTLMLGYGDNPAPASFALQGPDGSTLPEGGNINYYHDADARIMVALVTEPSPGTYSLLLDNEEGVPDSTYAVAFYRDVDNLLYISIDSTYHPGAIALHAALGDPGMASDMSAFGYFYDTLGQAFTLEFVDDGTNGDKIANDGTFTTLMQRQDQLADYSLQVNLFGEMNSTSFSRSALLDIPGCEGHQADFLVTDNCDSLEFLDLSASSSFINQIVETRWDMGDGTILTDSLEFNYIYAQSGTYTVELIAYSNLGCADTVSRQIDYQIAPGSASIFADGDTTLCGNESLAVSVDPHWPLTWWLDAATGDTLSTDSSYVITAPGDYLAQVATPLGCVNMTDTLKVRALDNPPSFDLQVLDSIRFCAGDSARLQAGNPESLYVWNTGDTTHLLTVRTSGEYYATFIDANGCPALSDTVSIEVFEVPDSAAIDPVFDNFACTGETITMTISLPANATMATWYRGDRPDFALALGSSYTADSTGNYYVILSNEAGCTYQTAAVPLYFYGLEASLTTEGPASVCTAEAAQVTLKATMVSPLGLENGKQGPPQGGGLNALVPVNNEYYEWYQIGVPKPIAAGTGLQEIDVTQSGDYLVIIYASNLVVSCSDSSNIVSVSIDVELEPNQLSVDGPLSFCEGADSVLLDAGPGFTTYLWNTGTTGRTLWVSAASQSGQHWVTYSNGGTCTANSDTVVVAIDAAPDMTMTFAPNGSPQVCYEGVETSVTASLPANSGVTYTWYEVGNPAPLQTGNSFSLFSEISSIEVYAVGTTPQGCTAQADPVTLAINPSVTAGPITADPAGGENSIGICNGQSVTLTAASPNGEFDSWYWLPTGDTTQSVVVDATTGYGSRTVRYINSQTGCETSDSYSVLNLNGNQLESAFEDLICEGDGNRLGIENPNAFDEYDWTLPYTPANPDVVTQPNVLALNIGEYTLRTVRYSSLGDACRDTTTFTIQDSSWLVFDPYPGIYAEGPEGSIITSDGILSVAEEGNNYLWVNRDADSSEFDFVNWFRILFINGDPVPFFEGSDVPLIVDDQGTFFVQYAKQRRNPFGSVGCVFRSNEFNVRQLDYLDDGPNYCTGESQTFSVVNPSPTLTYRWTIYTPRYFWCSDPENQVRCYVRPLSVLGPTLDIDFTADGHYRIELTATTTDGQQLTMSRDYTVGPCTTQLTEQYCGYTADQLTRTIVADTVPGAEGYRFRFQGSGIDEIVETTNGEYYLQLNQVPGISCLGSYQVTVEPVIPGRPTFFGPACSVNIRPGSQIIGYSSSGSGWNQNFTALTNTCAEKYHWYFQNKPVISPVPPVITRVSTTSTINSSFLGWEEGIELGEETNVWVALEVEGQLMPASEKISVTYQPLPVTQLTDCDQTLYQRDGQRIYWSTNSNAQQYYVRVTEIGNPTNFQVRSVGGTNSIDLGSFGDFIEWDKDYFVRISIRFYNGTQGGLGNRCTIRLRRPQGSILDSCPVQLVLDGSQYLTADDGSVGGFQQPERYRWTLHIVGTPTSATREYSGNRFYPHTVNWVVPGQELRSRVQYKVDGVWGAWSDYCTIYTPLNRTGKKDRSREGAFAERQSDWELFPNPLRTGILQVLLPADAFESGQPELEVINASGVRVYHQQLQDAQQLQPELDLSEQPAGIYLVRLKLGEAVLTKKLVITP